MMDYTTVVGLDVHKDTIVAAILPPGKDRASEIVKIANDPSVVEKFVRRRTAGKSRFVYEAGPCGYELQRQIAGLGFDCAVIAPGLTPVRPGDHVKTDRRDAEKLARLYRAGELTEIRIPTREQEAARDLVRAREDVLADRLSARHRLSQFLLRQGRIYRETKSWGKKHRAWLKTQQFECLPLQQSFEANVRALEEAESRLALMDQQVQDLANDEAYRIPVRYLRCLKGIDTLSALTLAVESQSFHRFERATSFMGFTGLVGREHSSANRIRRGAITKTGNAHIRRILVESSWCYRGGNFINKALIDRRKGCPPEVVRIAKKAQDRLHRKFWRMLSRNKPQQVAAVAIARELAGFVWSIAQQFPSGMN